MNIAIPESLKDYVQEQIDNQRYNNVDEYVSALIQADKIEKIREEFEKEIIIGLECKETIPVNDEFWKKIHEEIEQYHQEKKQ